MIGKYYDVLVPIVGLAANVFVQVAVFRGLRSAGLLRSVFVGFGSGMLVVIVPEFFRCKDISALSECLIMIFTNMTIYAALSYCYFHFINLGETARRIRILREIYPFADGLTIDEILDRYNAREMVEKRMARLLNNNQIICRDGKYYLGSKTMLITSKIILTMKKLLLGKCSEFE